MIDRIAGISALHAFWATQNPSHCIVLAEGASSFFPRLQERTMHDIVIRGGTIIDGTGKPAFTGDLAIAGERPRRGRRQTWSGSARDQRHGPVGDARLGRRAHAL